MKNWKNYSVRRLVWRLSGLSRKCLIREGIYEKAFRIDSTINIYELLLEMSRKMENKTLRKLMVFPKLLAFLYDRWMNTDDSHVEELTDCLERCIKEMEEEKQQKEQEAA